MSDTRTSKELLPRLRDGAAACERSADRHGDGDIGQMFHALAALMTDAGDAFERQREQIACLQQQVDALMLEYCPGEMSEEQRAEWAKHQKPRSAFDGVPMRVLEWPELPPTRASNEPRAARRFTGVGHLEETGYIPAGSAEERERAAQPPVPDDLKEATRLLHVLYAWYWRPATESDSARVDSLYPARGVGSYSIPLFAAIKALLDRYPYGGPSLTKCAEDRGG